VYWGALAQAVACADRCRPGEGGAHAMSRELVGDAGRSLATEGPPEDGGPPRWRGAPSLTCWALILLLVFLQRLSHSVDPFSSSSCTCLPYSVMCRAAHDRPRDLHNISCDQHFMVCQQIHSCTIDQLMHALC
jgi:hypothetical protein